MSGDTVLCAESEIRPGQGRAIQVGARSLLIVGSLGGLFAYENRCPHKGTSLDWVPGRVMNVEGTHLQCATHGALFRLEDGVCVAGPCLGDRLAPCAIVVRQGQIRLQK